MTLPGAFAVEDTPASLVRLPSEAPRRRSKDRLAIWDLPGTCHCVTIGTCLTLAELRRVASRLALFRNVEGLTDYELHGAFVHAMDARNRVSAAVQKMLEAKHAGMIRRASRCPDEAALERLWDEALVEGLVPGAFWALLTHPQLGSALEKRVFGEVHMMSHLCGASHRGDARAIAVIERQRAHLAQRLAKADADHRAAIAQRDGEIARLKRLVCALEPAIHQVADLKQRLADSRPVPGPAADPAAGEAMRRMQAETERLSAELKAALDRCRTAERRAEALAERLARIVVPDLAPTGCEASCPLNLGGRCVAYIGGRPQTVARIRSFVERCNGCLLAHDGGAEQSIHVLDGILSQADIVVVPVDCVSHNAMEKAKATCERRKAVFAALPSSSFSAFAAALSELGDRFQQ